jgi:hypothetical protein
VNFSYNPDPLSPLPPAAKNLFEKRFLDFQKLLIDISPDTFFLLPVSGEHEEAVSRGSPLHFLINPPGPS